MNKYLTMSWTDNPPKDWNLKLRYGKLKSPFTHFATITKGTFEEAFPEYGCPAGDAVMGLKVWAQDAREAARVSIAFGESIGFLASNDSEVYEAAPEEPPKQEPYVYQWTFHPFES